MFKSLYGQNSVRASYFKCLYDVLQYSNRLTLLQNYCILMESKLLLSIEI